jgi:23S rRNA pseudouridine2605 synthase
MRINKYVAQATGLSRRAADEAIKAGRVDFNGKKALLGDDVSPEDKVSIDGRSVESATKTTILLNKPTGYVTSRDGQGAQTVYALLPEQYHTLKPVGRLDKDSSGLLLMTNDGDLANQLTHPRYSKSKTYEIILDKPLQPLHQQMVADHGIKLDDGISKLNLQKLSSDKEWQVTMSEGRNRQIRRTFEALGYRVTMLCRTGFGPYKLSQLAKTQIFTQIKD